MAEKMKKGPSEAGRKTLKCPHKQGINLNMREQKGNPRLTLLVGCLAIVILAGCVAKFGVIDQYRRLDAAQAAYASVHTEYTQMQELLKGYDRLLMEYRTYSMEWATDGSEDNGTLVDRQKALDLLEQESIEPTDWLTKVSALEQRMDDMTEAYRRNQMKRMKQGSCSDEACIIFSELLTDFERIGDHALNIAQERAGIATENRKSVV